MTVATVGHFIPFPLQCVVESPIHTRNIWTHATELTFPWKVGLAFLQTQRVIPLQVLETCFVSLHVWVRVSVQVFPLLMNYICLYIGGQMMFSGIFEPHSRYRRLSAKMHLNNASRLGLMISLCSIFYVINKLYSFARACENSTLKGFLFTCAT